MSEMMDTREHLWLDREAEREAWRDRRVRWERSSPPPRECRRVCELWRRDARERRGESSMLASESERTCRQKGNKNKRSPS